MTGLVLLTHLSHTCCKHGMLALQHIWARMQMLIHVNCGMQVYKQQQAAVATEGSKETRFFEGKTFLPLLVTYCVRVLLRIRICSVETYGALHAALIWMLLAAGIQGKKGHEGELWGMGNLFKESLNKVKAQEIFANERPDLHFQIRKIDSQQLGAPCPLPHKAKFTSAIRQPSSSALHLSIFIPPACQACTSGLAVHRMTRGLAELSVSTAVQPERLAADGLGEGGIAPEALPEELGELQGGDTGGLQRLAQRCAAEAIEGPPQEPSELHCLQVTSLLTWPVPHNSTGFLQEHDRSLQAMSALLELQSDT